MRWRLFVWVCAFLMTVGTGVPGAWAGEPGRTTLFARGDRGRVEYGPGEGRILPRNVDAGVISRVVLREEMALGIGRFLQQVQVEARLLNGRFAGFRVVSLFRSRPEVRIPVLRPGDVVLRVNGHAIERPEQFKTAWDAMAEAKVLLLDIERNGRPSRLRYRIR